MAIPKEQLETWSNPGSQTKFKDAHESIRDALKTYDWPSGVDYGVYLQGSYKNSTTTRSNSDVDIVVQLNSAWKRDLSNLSKSEQEAYLKEHGVASYSWEDFRKDVISALKEKNSLTAKPGKKCIKVETPYLDADVVVCMQYRLYEKYQNSENQQFIEGMTFRAGEEWIINYPKEHDKNGTTKAKNTSGNYYPTVRIFKNIKSKLINDEVITSKNAPSYFIECLLYNVPNDKFVSNRATTTHDVLEYLGNNDISEFMCQNEIIDLFGDNPDQWNLKNAKKFIDKSIMLWNNWGK